MNKEEEVKVAKENMERLAKVKKENKKRVEKMKQENKIRMMLVFQENAALEEKLAAKLQEQEQALRSPKPTIKERAAPECPVSRKQFTSIFCESLQSYTICWSGVLGRDAPAEKDFPMSQRTPSLWRL